MQVTQSDLCNEVTLGSDVEVLHCSSGHMLGMTNHPIMVLKTLQFWELGLKSNYCKSPIFLEFLFCDFPVFHIFMRFKIHNFVAKICMHFQKFKHFTRN